MTKKLGVFVKHTSRDPIVESFRVIKGRYLPHRKLIAESNQLNGDALSAIKRHNDQSKTFKLKGNDVNTYIAASTLSHMLDGWGYLANALSAYINGNPGVAIHLAYYAELRAVMSLLASEGIGVFNDIHLGLDRNSKVHLFSKYRRRERQRGTTVTRENKIRTHTFAWDAFEKWCQSEVKPSYDLLRLFRVQYSGQNQAALG